MCNVVSAGAWQCALYIALATQWRLWPARQRASRLSALAVIKVSNVIVANNDFNKLSNRCSTTDRRRGHYNSQLVHYSTLCDTRRRHAPRAVSLVAVSTRIV